MALGDMTVAGLATLLSPAIVESFGGAALGRPVDYGPVKFLPGAIDGDIMQQYAGYDMASLHPELGNVDYSTLTPTYQETVTHLEWAMGARCSKKLLDILRGGTIPRRALAEIAQIGPRLWESLTWRIEFEIGRFFGRFGTDNGPDGFPWASATHPSGPGVGNRDNIQGVASPSMDAIRDMIIALSTRRDWNGREMKLGPKAGVQYELWVTPDNEWVCRELLTGWLPIATYVDTRWGSTQQPNPYAPCISGIRVVPESWGYHLICLAHPDHQWRWAELAPPGLEDPAYRPEILGTLFVGSASGDILGGAFEFFEFKWSA